MRKAGVGQTYRQRLIGRNPKGGGPGPLRAVFGQKVFVPGKRDPPCKSTFLRPAREGHSLGQIHHRSVGHWAAAVLFFAGLCPALLCPAEDSCSEVHMLQAGPEHSV